MPDSENWLLFGYLQLFENRLNEIKLTVLVALLSCACVIQDKYRIPKQPFAVHTSNTVN